MSAASPERIAELLAERYIRSPVLTWRDTDGDYRDHLTDIEAAVAEQGFELITRIVDGDELGTKYHVYNTLDSNRADGTSAENRRQLIYRTGQIPAMRDNWLLDVEVGYGIFTADTAAILVHDLGLADRGIDGVVKSHLAAFGVSGRVEAIRERLAEVPGERSAPKLADDLRAFLSAEVLGLHGPGSHRLHRIVASLLEEFVTEVDSGYRALESSGLVDFLWSGCADIYGYAVEKPSVAGLATWMFNQAWHGWPEARNPARIDFERLRDDRHLRGVFTALAELAQDDLNIAERLHANMPSVAELADHDVFPVVDGVIVRALAAAIFRRTMPPEAAQDIVRKRSTTTWFGDHQHSYKALASAADCLSRIESFAPVIADAADGVRRYADKWAYIDLAYRSFRHHATMSETDLPKELLDLVERRYVHDYQRHLAQEWQKQIDRLDEWKIPDVESLRDFARYDLPAKAKTLVVISDAFRYEVGLELAARMNADDWFTATVEPRLSPLPSVTCLGMAALLPQTKLELVDGDTVRADGAPTSGLAARDALWEKVNAKAIDFATVMSLSAADRGALWSAHDSVVVYHDTIDAVGHKSPHQTPEACSRALEDIARLVKRFGSGKMRASRVLVTADHGFLYQDSDLEPADYLSEGAHGEQIVAAKRRFVVGRDLREHPSFTTWTSKQLRLDGDLEVQSPRGLHRLRMQGAGYQYVHGGTSLQEIVVPLVTLTQSRKDSTRKVNVDVNVSTPTITSSTVMVSLLQRDAVSGKVRGRELVVGVYAADGTSLSGQRTVLVDSTAEDVRDRGRTLELVLNEEAEAHNGETVVIRADEMANGTRSEYRSTTATLQRGFGGFFDAL